MRKYLFAAALVLTPVIALAEHPEGTYVADIQSQIRDDYRQLAEDRDAGYTEAVRDDESQIAQDKMRLREAQAHPDRYIAGPPRANPVPATPDSDSDHTGDQVNAAPPTEHPESDDWKESADKNPDVPFNHAARVDDEIR